MGTREFTTPVAGLSTPVPHQPVGPEAGPEEEPEGRADLGVLVRRTGFQVFGGERVVREEETARAMKLVAESGGDLARRAIWKDRETVFWGLLDRPLREWLGSRDPRLSGQWAAIDATARARLARLVETTARSVGRRALHIDVDRGDTGPSREMTWLAAYLGERGHRVSLVRGGRNPMVLVRGLGKDDEALVVAITQVVATAVGRARVTPTRHATPTANLAEAWKDWTLQLAIE